LFPVFRQQIFKIWQLFHFYFIIFLFLFYNFAAEISNRSSDAREPGANPGLYLQL